MADRGKGRSPLSCHFFKIKIFVEKNYGRQGQGAIALVKGEIQI